MKKTMLLLLCADLLLSELGARSGGGRSFCAVVHEMRPALQSRLDTDQSIDISSSSSPARPGPATTTMSRDGNMSVVQGRRRIQRQK